jgi:hypothetical protein
MVATLNAPAHEAGTLEDADVFGDGVERYLEWRRDFGHARVAYGEALEYLAACLVRQCQQGVVEAHGRKH